MRLTFSEGPTFAAAEDNRTPAIRSGRNAFRPIAQLHRRPHHDFARHLRRLRHPLSTCRLASRWTEYMAFLRSFYVANDIWRLT